MKKMKSKICAVLVIILLIIMASTVLAGCSKNPGIQASKGYDRAMLKLPDGTIIAGTLNDYTLWSVGSMTVTIDGQRYWAHPANVVLWEE